MPTFLFTAFVGEVVYEGVSSVPINSTLYQQDIEGVRVGLFDLAISSSAFMIVSLTIF